MSQEVPRHRGLLAPVKRFWAAFLEALATRGELFAVELQEEKLRLITVFVLASSGVFLATIAVVMVMIVVLLAVGPGYRLVVAAGFCVVLFGGAVFCFVKLREMLQHGPKPFAETINQLRKDRACLRPSDTTKS
jgi:uncharacterized membrane protein YqjE